MINYYQEGVCLKGDKVILRDMEYTDCLAIHQNIYSNKDVLKYYIDEYESEPDQQRFQKFVDSYQKHSRYLLSIVEKSTGKVIGVMLQCNTPNPYFHEVEVGYAIGESYWNNGYTTEALQLFMNFLFSQGVHRVFCLCIRENGASARVMEKCGMQLEGLSKERIYYNDHYWDVFTYSRINGD